MCFQVAENNGEQRLQVDEGVDTDSLSQPKVNLKCNSQTKMFNVIVTALCIQTWLWISLRYSKKTVFLCLFAVAEGAAEGQERTE